MSTIAIPSSLEDLLDPEYVDPQEVDTLTRTVAGVVFSPQTRRSEVPPALRDEYDRYRAARRRARSRAQAKRKREAEVKDVRPIDPQRVRAGLVVMLPLMEMITNMTLARYWRMRRVLGGVGAHDIAATAYMGAAEAVARQGKFDLVRLLAHAKWLASQPGIPDLHHQDPDGARWLIRVMATQVRDATVEAYRSSTTVGYERGQDGEIEKVDRTFASLDYLDTVLGDGGVDALIERSMANRKPHFGSKEPGGDERRAFLRMVMDAAITTRNLDWLADLLLDEEKVRSDGAFLWSENALVVWDALRKMDPAIPPLPEGSKPAQARMVRKVVRRLFDYLPDVLAKATELIADPVALEKHLGRNYLPAVEQVPSEGRVSALVPPHPVDFMTRMDENMRDLHNGKRYVLEGADEENPQMTRLYDPPSAEEWKKVRKVEPSELKCKHGQRAAVFGSTKKAHKHPRPWVGHFCPLPKDAPDACPPVFNGKELAKIEPAAPEGVRMNDLPRMVMDILSSGEVLA